MAEEKSLGKFLVYCCLILFSFLVMIPLIFAFKCRLFKLELLVFLFLVLLSLIGFIGYKCCWGERVLFFVFWIQMINLLFIWKVTGKLFVLPLLLVIVGFLMGLPKRGGCCCNCKEEEKEKKKELRKELFENKDNTSEDVEVEIVEEENDLPKKETSKKVEATHSPGKYVASKMGSVYHEPKCTWAKKIADNRRVWFKDKKEASKKKYKKHSCVK
ncbi:hypothetical protein ACFL0E_00180 [Nanoarchaeota archaeon]